MHRYRQRLAQALNERLVLPLRQLSGLEVSVAVAIGVIGGVFPVPLVTSIVTLAVGWYVQCNAAEFVVGSTVNFFCTPIQLALLPSFARLMGAILQKETSTFTAYALKEAIAKGYASFLSSCIRMVAYATIAWFLVCIPVIIVLRSVQKCAVYRQLRKESECSINTEEMHVSEGR